MSSQRSAEAATATLHEQDGALKPAHRQFEFRGPWFCAAEAAAYVPNRSVKAFYMWRTRHGIIARSNGSVAKADLDRVLNRRKPRRVVSPVSLANLRKRVVHADQSTAELDSSVIPEIGKSK